MDDLDPAVTGNRTGLIIGIVVVGVSVLGLGAYLAYNNNNKGNGVVAVAANPKGMESWCKLRQEWAKKVNTMAGDIMLKSIKEQDKEARDELVITRNRTCHEYAEKLRDLLTGDPRLWTAVQKIEESLIKEGKLRANVSVEIDNLLAKPAESTSALANFQDALKTAIVKRITNGKADADAEIKTALSALKGVACAGIYRGPMTDKGTSSSPYITWDEIEMKRTLAIKEFDARIKELEPSEQFANRIRHDLMARYKGVLRKCFKKAKAKNPKMSDQLGLRVRLSKTGQVKTLAIEWMNERDESILDCLLDDASRWKLSRPEPGMEMTVVSLDFSKI